MHVMTFQIAPIQMFEMCPASVREITILFYFALVYLVLVYVVLVYVMDHNSDQHLRPHPSRC